MIVWSDITYPYSENEKERLCQILNSSELDSKKEVLERINNGEPYQYVVGKTWFYNLELQMNKYVLIPRPETEELVDYLNKNLEAKNILDLCTGSGCIALALKSCWPNANVKGVDVSAEALEVAKLNSKELGFNINWIQDDVLNLKDNYGQYDLIVSNPPYIGVKEELSETVANFEPTIALISNGDVLKFYKAILKVARKHLKSGGMLALEINQKYGAETLALFTEFDAELLKDMSGNDRFVVAKVV